MSESGSVLVSTEGFAALLAYEDYYRALASVRP